MKAYMVGFVKSLSWARYGPKSCRRSVQLAIQAALRPVWESIAASLSRTLAQSRRACCANSGLVSWVRRYLLQSSGFWYAPGAGLASESVPFISSASPGVEANARTYLELEARASATP